MKRNYVLLSFYAKLNNPSKQWMIWILHRPYLKLVVKIRWIVPRRVAQDKIDADDQSESDTPDQKKFNAIKKLSYWATVTYGHLPLTVVFSTNW